MCNESNIIYINTNFGLHNNDILLKDKKTVGMHDIDTRELTRHLRINGSLNGIISTKNFDLNYLGTQLKNFCGSIGDDPVKKVSCQSAYIYNENLKNPK